MRGEVFQYEEQQGFGFISGDDGKRYAFERKDLRRLVPIGKGTTVEFQVDAASAREIFVVHGVMPGAAAQFGRDAVAAEPEGTGLWSYFIRALTTNYANFSGRARRKEYWGYVLFLLIFAAIVIGVAVALDVNSGNLDVSDELPVITISAIGLLILATLIPSIAITVRRQHDIGISGWFYLLIFVPYVGNMIIFVFTLIPSQRHENKWGPIPFGVRI
jgi:uncharacterized membrane protein YhaH (DUF805 family)/cold shock CspA family protein